MAAKPNHVASNQPSDYAPLQNSIGVVLAARFLIGIDFGTLSARGVLIDVDANRQVDQVVVSFRHGLITAASPGSLDVSPEMVLHRPSDYLEACKEILRTLGGYKHIHVPRFRCERTDRLLRPHIQATPTRSSSCGSTAVLSGTLTNSDRCIPAA
jgi:hypothetical protein